MGGEGGFGCGLICVSDVDGEILKERRHFSPFVFVLTSGDNTAKAAEVAKEVVGEEGSVVTLQNGYGFVEMF